jgi:TRAP-type C4-dicarboxylate transport system permease small subunit
MGTSVAMKSRMDRLANLCLTLAGLALLALVCVQAWQVIARYVLNASPSWAEPISTLLLATLMSLSAAAGVHHHSHFNFALLVERAAPNVQRWVSRLKLVCISALGVTMALWSGVLAFDGADIHQAGVALSIGAIYLPCALGGALIAIFALAHLINSSAAHSNPPALATNQNVQEN